MQPEHASEKHDGQGDLPDAEFRNFEACPAGEYGGGQVAIWDKGTYETEKWSDREVMVVLHGKRTQGRYVLFRTNGKNWMIHRMDPPLDPERKPMPGRIEPMIAKLGTTIPKPESSWAFEFKWDGIRALAHVDGGRVRLLSRSGEDITPRYPEIHAIGRALGSREVILDGEVVALDDKGRPSFEEIQQRMGLTSESEVRRKMKLVPVTYMAFDLLWQDGHSLLDQPYTERRRLLAVFQNGNLTASFPVGFQNGCRPESASASISLLANSRTLPEARPRANLVIATPVLSRALATSIAVPSPSRLGFVAMMISRTPPFWTRRRRASRVNFSGPMFSRGANLP